MIEDILIFIGIAIILYIIVSRIVRSFYKFPAPACIGYFLDSRWRKKLQSPEKIIQRSGIKEGMRVMDLGCGPGTFTMDVARAIGEDGELFAVDVQYVMIAKLEKKLKRPENKNINNIVTKVANAYGLPFQDNFFDLVYMISVLPEIQDKKRALKEVSRVLKYHGILAITEFLPDPDYPLRRTTKKWCEQAEFKFLESRGNFFNYTMQFKKYDFIKSIPAIYKFNSFSHK